MAYKPSKRRRAAIHLETGLNLTPVMNIIMIIIPFLLLTAVFAKTAIIDIYLPQEVEEKVEMDESDEQTPELLIVTITDDNLVLGGIGEGIVIPATEGKIDFRHLTKELVKLKEMHPQKEDIILLFDPQISYDTVIKAMDASRETTDGTKQVLFPMVSLGENK